MPNENAPFHPIIYVRGYAMSAGEIDQTTADPFCGFNVGSTVFRAVPDKKTPPRKFVFESPVVRLASDFGYSDVFEDGRDILDPEWTDDPQHQLTSRSIVIHRYYDEASTLLGKGKTPEIEVFAEKLGELILRVRELVCANAGNQITPEDFRCYLVAHSMGGLVCRALLQNPAIDKKNAARFVDKFFTYASPHNGIDVAGHNIPSWLAVWNLSNFDRDERMPDYLGVKSAFKKTKRVDWIPESRFPHSRVFCMVGTNRLDYEAAAGLARTFVGHGSDGLVRIENATLRGLKPDGEPGEECAKAFCYRSHSGYFGIVNSEEAYQNLVRFLFGNVRVDIWVDFEEIRLPKPVAEAEAAGRKVNALYQIELLASPRGKLWFLTRRVAEEDSVACLSHAEWKAAPKKCGSIYLSTAFLANWARVNKVRPSLAYSATLGIRVPDYEIDKKLWVNEHFEGGYVFRNAVVVELVPPDATGGTWEVKYSWQNLGAKSASSKIDPKVLRSGKAEIRIPFDSKTTPGATGALRFMVSEWNGE